MSHGARTRWVVRAGDGATVLEVLKRAGSDADAIADGRVFVGRRRALRGDEPVVPGNEVWIAVKSAPVAPMVVLLDEDGLVAVDKPADVVTIPDQHGAEGSLLDSLARTLGVAPLTLHATSRIDRGVSGVVVFARTPAAAERLREARERGAYGRRYVAIAATPPTDAEALVWDAPIGRGTDPRHRAVNGPDSTSALSRFAIAGRATVLPWTLLALDPATGRTHQLRVHSAHAGAPLLGDRVYGGPSRVTLPTGSVQSFDRIALHAARIRIPRADGTILEVSSPVPPTLRRWWAAARGDDADWARALLDLTALRG